MAWDRDKRVHANATGSCALSWSAARASDAVAARWRLQYQPQGLQSYVDRLASRTAPAARLVVPPTASTPVREARLAKRRFHLPACVVDHLQGPLGNQRQAGGWAWHTVPAGAATGRRHLAHILSRRPSSRAGFYRDVGTEGCRCPPVPARARRHAECTRRRGAAKHGDVAGRWRRARGLGRMVNGCCCCCGAPLFTRESPHSRGSPAGSPRPPACRWLQGGRQGRHGGSTRF